MVKWLLLLAASCSSPADPSWQFTLGVSNDFSTEEKLELQAAADDWNQVAPVRIRLIAGADVNKASMDAAGRTHEDNTVTIDPRVEIEDLRLVFAHELGHVMGLPHSDNQQDIMWKDINPPRGISAADVRRLEEVLQ